MKKICKGILHVGSRILCALWMLGQMLLPVSGRPIPVKAISEAAAIEFNYVHDMVLGAGDQGPLPLARGPWLDPAGNGFRVRPKSPALRVGFKNFKMGLWGITNDFPAAWRDE